MYIMIQERLHAADGGVTKKAPESAPENRVSSTRKRAASETVYSTLTKVKP